MIFKIDPTKSVVCSIDVSFAGDWNQSWSEEPFNKLNESFISEEYIYVPIVGQLKLHSIVTQQDSIKSNDENEEIFRFLKAIQKKISLMIKYL